LEDLLAISEQAPIDAKLRPLLNYVRKLTLAPARLTPDDSDAVYAAGWDDTALFHTIAVCAYFNMLNRLVEGTGVKGDSVYHRGAGQKFARDGYLIRPEDR